MFAFLLIYGICLLLNFLFTGIAFGMASTQKQLDGVAAFFILSFTGPLMTVMILGATLAKIWL